MSDQAERVWAGAAAASENILLTRDVAGIGGRLRERDADFVVEEMPLYAPDGEGEHVYLFIEKRGMTTMDVASVLARHFGVGRGAVGFAGLKDKNAITRQTFSVHAPGRAIEDVPMITHPQLTVLWVDRHRNKLRRGHLAGNRFSIRVRGVEMSAAVRALRSMQMLERDGLANAFGPQRFGLSGRNHLVGRALLLNDCDEATRVILGDGGDQATMPERQREALAHYARGDLDAALAAMPHHLQVERLLLMRLVRGASTRDAWGAIDPAMRGLFYSAFQAAVFNRVLERRIEAGLLAGLIEGDLVGLGSARRLTQVDTANRAELLALMQKHELSATGPMWGRSMQRAGGTVDELELDALAEAGLTPDLLAACQDRRCDMVDGTRRVLRVRVSDIEVEGGIDEHGAFVRCAFDLPRGAFATSVMREVMKVDPGVEEIEDA